VKQILIASLLNQPLLSVWLGAVAFALRRRRGLSRVVAGTAAILLVGACLPLLVKPAAAVLIARAENFDAVTAGRAGSFDLVLVPTGGVFLDPGGEIWPSRTSIERATLGLSAARMLALPAIISGGVTTAAAKGVAEASAVASSLQSRAGAGIRIILDDTARDSCATAESLARVASASGIAPSPRILLVTSPQHLRRMGACLTAHGLDWRGLPASAGGVPARISLPRDALPSAAALSLANAVLYETAGIVAYLVTRRIGVGDLF